MQGYLYALASDKHEGLIPAVIRPFLFLLSFIYGLIVRILVFFYRFSPYRLQCKVISVGNITLGGTGKTPVVEFIARYLKEQGHKVAILSRGYARRRRQDARGNTQYEAMGDEPYMLAKNLGDIPVVVDEDRIKAAKQAIKDYAVDTVILDDGFQQWRIIKDLEIVVIDATNPFGNRHLIPRGILREPLFSLRRADIFILTKTNLVSYAQNVEEALDSFNPGGLIVKSAHSAVSLHRLAQDEETLDMQAFKPKIVTLFSGIGDPSSFENLIRGLGFRIGLSFRFLDHYNYKQSDIEDIICKSKRQNIETIITTQKDAVRILGSQLSIPDSQLLFLRIGIKIAENEQRLHNRLLKLYSF